MSSYMGWTDEQIHTIVKIGLKNSQVRMILKDEDVFKFFESLISDYESDSDEIKEIRKLLEME